MRSQGCLLFAGCGDIVQLFLLIQNTSESSFRDKTMHGKNVAIDLCMLLNFALARFFLFLNLHFPFALSALVEYTTDRRPPSSS